MFSLEYFFFFYYFFLLLILQKNRSICDGDVALATFPTLAKNYSTVDALNQLPVCEDSINSYNNFCKCVIKNGKGINDFNVGLPG